MNNRLDNELVDLCASNNLSLVALQETINLLGSRLSSQNPGCIHKACYNENVTLEMVQLLHNTLPGALQLSDNYGSLPIHRLCYNQELDGTNSLDILRFMLSIDPTLAREVDGDDYLPINVAVEYKSIAFCKELIDKYPESLRIESGTGRLPIHEVCRYGNQDDTADTIQYMLELDPELINEVDSDGWVPIHYAAANGITESIELLLKFDPNAASKKVNNGSRWLPLHFACAYHTNLSSIQALYDAYPEAIFVSDGGRRTPLDIARKQPAIDFLQTQLVYAQQSRNTAFMSTIDENGLLQLHRALKDDAPLGSIKLLIKGNPTALQLADHNGVYPVHIACKFSSDKVVKYLVELAGDTLNNVDANKDSPLHYACCGGSLNVLKYLLEANVPSVSERNNDSYSFTFRVWREYT